MPPEAWERLRWVAATCLRLHAFSHDVSSYWGQRKDELEPQPGSAEPTWLAISRHDFVVERQPLSAAQFELLSGLAAGETLPVAIDSALRATGDPELESQLGGWFADWMAAGFFAGLSVAG